MAIKIPRIRRYPGGNVQIKFPDGIDVIVPDSTTDAALIVPEDHPYFEIMQHLLAVIVEHGRTLGDAADSNAFKMILDKYRITPSSREQI